MTGFRGFWRVFVGGASTRCSGAGIIPQGTGEKTPAHLRAAGFLELKLLDPVANLVPVQSQERGGTCLVPTGPLERLNEQRAFELLEIDAGGGELDPIAQVCGAGRSSAEVVGRQ